MLNIVSYATQQQYQLLQQGVLIEPVPIQKKPEIITLKHEPSVDEALRLLSEEYKDFPAAANAPHSKEGVLKGGTPYFNNLLAQKIRELTKENIRPTTLKEYFEALRNGRLTKEELLNTYRDIGFAFYPINAKNILDSKNLMLNMYAAQFARFNFPNVNVEEPFVLYGLMKIRKDPRFEHKLIFDVNEDGLTYADNFSLLAKGDGKFSSEDKGLVKKGFPEEFDENGDFNLWTAKDDARWFYLYGGRNLNARDGNLDNSNASGRVCVTKNFSSGNQGLEKIVA